MKLDVEFVIFMVVASISQNEFHQGCILNAVNVRAAFNQLYNKKVQRKLQIIVSQRVPVFTLTVIKTKIDIYWLM